jgi:beta-galactosidase
VKEVKFLMENNYPFSIYMAHGGTNFGFWAGANFDETTKRYAADITSYDYDAAINEMG